jgi:putative IMPACT (imprinted ancient) family translation regulator
MTIHNIITDRGSSYTVSWGAITSREEIKPRLKEHLSDKYFQKATHNTYAWRVLLPDGGILEAKNDDGETWAGYCILRELQRTHMVNVIVVVTRYFGGIQLHADRFTHGVNATKALLEKYPDM